MFNLDDYFKRMNQEPGEAGGGGVADPAPEPSHQPDPTPNNGILDGGEPPAPAPTGDPAPTDEPVSFVESIPEDWRTQLISSMGLDGDEKTKAEKMLSRVTDFKTLTKNYFEAQDKIRAGLAKDTSLPEDATDEQLREYREANGIPESPDGYELQLEEGLVMGEEDSRVMNEVFKTAHELNLPADAMSKLTNSMLQARQNEIRMYEQQDGVDRQNAERMLRENWGSDFETNRNMIASVLNQLPETVREDFMSARLANGQALFNSPEVAVFFADIARKINPAGTVVPNSSNPMQSINDEISKLESKMGTDEWFKDQASQQRYQQLVEARDNMKQ